MTTISRLDHPELLADDGRTRTSWWPRPLTGTPGPPIEPAVLRRTDGVPLLYPGRLNALVGESESCKTWAAYVGAVETAIRQQHVLIVDFEDYETTCQTRLLALGLAPKTITNYIHFLHPEEPLLDRSGRVTSAQQDLDEALRTWPITYSVFDGVTEGMSLDALDPLDNGDVARWYRAVPKRITATGACGAVVDHVTKDREQRGRYALGGVHKLNGLDGAAYTLEAVEPFAPGHIGRIRITVAKDRPGYVRAHAIERKKVGDLILDATEPDMVSSTFTPAVADGDFAPTHLMEKVSRRCELYPGETKSELRRLGNSDYVDKAITVLVAQHYIRIERAGNAHRHYSIQPYRELPEPDTDE